MPWMQKALCIWEKRMNNILEFQKLNILFEDLTGKIQAVSDLSFGVRKGEILGLVGESGSGKSVTAKAGLQLLEKAEITGSVMYHGEDLLSMKKKKICAIRGAKITMVFQEPMTALNPVVKVGKQIEEVLKIHKIGNKKDNQESIKSTLKMLNIENADEIIEKYPFELSGGLRQRIVIAMAIISRPEIIIADEPTTALDSTTQMEIVALLRKTVKEIGSSVLLITHDLGVIAECADRVVVMYKGRKMEECSVEKFFQSAMHPYSKELLDSRPSNFNGRYFTVKEKRQGNASGCPYWKKCTEKLPQCEERIPDETVTEEDHTVYCWRVM